MTDLTWVAIRNDTINRFNGQTPRPQDEAITIDVFEVHPQLVLRAIDETAQALAEGKITWAWSILAARLTRGTQALRDTTVDTSTSKAKAIERAKGWITNAGLHYDRADHIEADLFGDQYAKGPLTSHDTTELRQQMADHWHTHRPRGIQAEADHEQWNAKCRADRALVLALQAKHQTTEDSTDIDFDS